MPQRPKRGSSLVPGIIVLALLLLVLSREAIVRALVELSPPHGASAPAAHLDGDLAAQVDAALSRADIADVSGTIDAALAISGEALSFGLSHRTSLSFSPGAREGNCVEYAHLFGHVFNRAAASSGLNATASVIHSSRARLLGFAIPLRGFRDHDWVLIEDRTGTGLTKCSTRAACKYWYVDPTLHDAWLGWDINSMVKGLVRPAGG